MQSIDDKSIDMILCDLPYGTTACSWDNYIELDFLWCQYERIIKNNGAIVLTASQPFTSELVVSNINLFKYELIWHKTTSAGFVTSKKQPMKYHENILIFYKSLPVYNPQFQKYANSTNKRFKDGEIVNRRKQLIKSSNQIQGGISFEGKQGIELNRGKYPESVLKISSVPNCNNIRLHPTQKPVALFEYLIKTYTNENELVLDNCIGSGTTAIACMQTNRNFIGIELEPKYVDIANKRIADFKQQLSLGV
jgi:site-specific DNA-methyltransferase (adenine-specific)